MNTILSWNVRGILIGGLFLSAELCHASTINAPKISPKSLKILPQFRFLKKETIVPIRVNIVHSPVLDVRRGAFSPCICAFCLYQSVDNLLQDLTLCYILTCSLRPGWNYIMSYSLASPARKKFTLWIIHQSIKVKTS